MLRVDDDPSIFPRIELAVPRRHAIILTFVYFVGFVAILFGDHVLGESLWPGLGRAAGVGIALAFTLSLRQYYSVTRESIVWQSYVGPWRMRALDIPIEPGLRVEPRREQPPLFSLQFTKSRYVYGESGIPVARTKQGREIVEWLNSQLKAASA